MRQGSWLRLWAIGVALSGVNMRAQAQMCAQDSECGKGFSCQVTAAGTCPAIACAPGEKCMQPSCDPVVYRECRPAQCSTDTDCADGMVCYAGPVTCGGTIAVAPCPPDQTCPEVKPTCPEPTRMCTPRYVLPCQQASDCGAAGWACKAVQECSCSGSAGSPTPSAGAVPGSSAPMVSAAPTPEADAGTAHVGSGGGGQGATPPTEKPVIADGGVAPTPPIMDPRCECHDSAEMQCEALEIDCASDADCPAEFVCQHLALPQTGGGSGSCTGSRDGGVICTEDPPAPAPETAGKCWPKYAGTSKSGGSLGLAMPTTSVPAAGAQGTNGPSDQPSVPPTTHGGTVSGSDTNAERGGADAGAVDEDVSSTPKCSVNGVGLASSSGSGLAWLTVAIGLVWYRRRRQA
jgi:hypothetical protein